MEIARFALEALNIDRYGLDEIDNKILCTIIDKFKGRTGGFDHHCYCFGRRPRFIEEVYEPFLIKEGFLKRTPRGREVTELSLTSIWDGVSIIVRRHYLMIKYGRIKIISQRHCNIWTKQHCGAFPELFAYAHLCSSYVCGFGRLWGGDRSLCLTALLMVILTYGMETTFFRFVNKETENSERVYSTVLFMVGSTSLVFAALCMLFLHPVAGMMGYGDHPWYIGMMALVIAMDAFQCIPFAYLRYKKRPIRFAALKLLFILLNITLNLVYYVVMKGSDVFYAFFFNLICTSVIMVLMVPLSQI